MFAAPGPRASIPSTSQVLPRDRGGRRASVSDDEHPSPWRHVRAELRRAVSDATWHQWLEPLRAREVGGGALVIEAPADIRPWVADHFGRLLQACAAAVLGPDVEVDLVAADAPAGPPPPSAAQARTDAADAINPRYTFEQFV